MVTVMQLVKLSVISFFIVIVLAFLCAVATRKQHTIIGAFLYLGGCVFQFISKYAFLGAVLLSIFKLVQMLN